MIHELWHTLTMLFVICISAVIFLPHFASTSYKYIPFVIFYYLSENKMQTQYIPYLLERSLVRSVYIAHFVLACIRVIITKDKMRR